MQRNQSISVEVGHVEKKHHMPAPLEKIRTLRFLYPNKQPVVDKTIYYNKRQGNPEYYVLGSNNEEIIVCTLNALIRKEKRNIKTEALTPQQVRSFLEKQKQKDIEEKNNRLTDNTQLGKKHLPAPLEKIKTLKLLYPNKQPVVDKTIYYNKRQGQPEYYVLGSNNEEIIVCTMNAFWLKGTHKKAQASQAIFCPGKQQNIEEKNNELTHNTQQNPELSTDNRKRSIESETATESSSTKRQRINEGFIDNYSVMMTHHTANRQVVQANENNFYRNSLVALTRMFDGTPTVLSSQEQEEIMDIFDLNDPTSDLSFEVLTKGLK